MKLTETQRKVLEAMRDGAKWHGCECPFCYTDLWKDGVRLHVSWQTVDALVRGGMIARYGRYDYVLKPEALEVL